MAYLQLARKAHQANVMHRPSILYKRIVKELPRILMIYDLDVPLPKAKATIRGLFYDQDEIKDSRVSEMLVEQGYMSLESTLLQHKQKTHVLQLLEGYLIPNEADRKRLKPDSSIDEQFMRN